MAPKVQLPLILPLIRERSRSRDNTEQTIMKRKHPATEQTRIQDAPAPHVHPMIDHIASVTADATEHSHVLKLRPRVVSRVFVRYNELCCSYNDAPWPNVTRRNALAPENKQFAQTGTWSHFIDRFQRSYTIYLIDGTTQPLLAACLALYTKMHVHSPTKKDDLDDLLAHLCDVIKRRFAWRSILDDILQDNTSWLNLRTSADRDVLLNFIEHRSDANHETFKSIKADLKKLRGSD